MEDALPSAPTLAVAEPPPPRVRGLDAAVPELPDEDAGFVDPLQGWSWSGLCSMSLQRGELGFAMGRCMEGLRVAPDVPSPRSPVPDLLENVGRIEERRGEHERASQLFALSRQIRANFEAADASDAVR